MQDSFPCNKSVGLNKENNRRQGIESHFGDKIGKST